MIFYIEVSILSEATNAKIKMRQYAIYSKPRKFDTANMKCFTVLLQMRMTVLFPFQKEILMVPLAVTNQD